MKRNYFFASVCIIGEKSEERKSEAKIFKILNINKYEKHSANYIFYRKENEENIFSEVIAVRCNCGKCHPVLNNTDVKWETTFRTSEQFQEYLEGKLTFAL